MRTKLVLTGVLTKKPEVKTGTTKDGKEYAGCYFSLAQNERVSKDKQVTTYLRCHAWNQPAKYLAQYGEPGMAVTVLATLTNSMKDGKAGDMLLECDQVEFVNTKRKKEEQQAQVDDYSDDNYSDDIDVQASDVDTFY